MKPNLVIKHTLPPGEKIGFDLTSLGESFIGFNEIFKELFEISAVKGELEVRTLRITEGSIITELFIIVLTAMPFEYVKDLQTFLSFTDPKLLTQLQNYLSQFENAHRTLNDYFRDNQFDLQVVTILMTIFITKMIAITPAEKEKTILKDKNGNEIPGKYAEKLRQMVHHRRYKKALKPITDNNVSEIILYTVNTDKKAIINDQNFEGYLGEEEQILPELQNGNVYSFSGEILALQRKHQGRNIKIQSIWFRP